MDSENIVLLVVGVLAALFVLLAYKALTRSRRQIDSPSDSTSVLEPSLGDVERQEAEKRAALEAEQAERDAAAASAQEAEAQAAAKVAAAQEEEAQAAVERASKAREEAEADASEQALAAEAAAREAAERAASDKAAAEAAVKAASAQAAAAETAAQEASDRATRVAEENAAAMKQGLERTRSSLLGKLSELFSRATTIDDEVLDELEEVLISADVGVKLTMTLVDNLRDQAAAKQLSSTEDVQAALKALLLDTVGKDRSDEGAVLAKRDEGPKVFLFVGVNGVGKTTSIGKIGSLLVNEGHDVVMTAGDTFRAAAVDQLKVWGERTSSKVIAGEEGTDPASVVFNGVQHGVQVGADFILCDTAGRLHTKSELMDEIKKVRRAAGKAHEGAPHEVILVVDGTSGQNALIQAREFNDAVGLTGVILTKLDGTAKGGVVVAIAHELKVPIRFVGVGEKAEDLRPFDARSFVEGLFES